MSCNVIIHRKKNGCGMNLSLTKYDRTSRAAGDVAEVTTVYDLYLIVYSGAVGCVLTQIICHLCKKDSWWRHQMETFSA